MVHARPSFKPPRHLGRGGIVLDERDFKEPKLSAKTAREDDLMKKREANETTTCHREVGYDMSSRTDGGG
jgi:hypothetical protein